MHASFPRFLNMTNGFQAEKPEVVSTKTKSGRVAKAQKPPAKKAAAPKKAATKKAAAKA